MDFKYYSYEKMIPLVDVERGSDIGVKYGHVKLPDKLPRVFTSNQPMWPADPHGALRNRIFKLQIFTSLIPPAAQQGMASQVIPPANQCSGSDFLGGGSSSSSFY